MKLNVMCVGDVVGRPGRRILAEKLETIVKELDIDCVIANSENAAGGSGLTPQIYDKLGKYGVNIVTLGDHAYRKKDIISVMETKDDIVRPLNWGGYSAGKGYAVYKTAKGASVAVISLMGRTFMKPSNCPFEAIDNNLIRISRMADVVFVEMHAEATSDKVAMGYYLDGKVSCVYGTHTHIPTADEKIREKGTAYITDIGMTGPCDSVLGRGKDNVIKSLRTQMPFPYDIATGDVRIQTIVVTVDTSTKKAEKIERLEFKWEETEDVNYDSDDGRPEPLGNF